MHLSGSAFCIGWESLSRHRSPRFWDCQGDKLLNLFWVINERDDRMLNHRIQHYWTYCTVPKLVDSEAERLLLWQFQEVYSMFAEN